LIRILLLIAVPFGGTVSHRLQGLNDEVAHLNYVAYLADHRAFPVQVHHALEPGAMDRADFEYYQPPLYYLLCSPLYALLERSVALYACRLVSFLCGLLSLLAFSRILEGLGCAESSRRQAVAFLALLPCHAYFSAMVSNDSLTWLIGFLLTGRLFALYDRTRLAPGAIGRPGLHAVLGLLLGLGMLAKPSMAVFYPVALFAYGYTFLCTRRAVVIWCGLLALGISLAVAGPWYLRNVTLYGSPLALHIGLGPPSESAIIDRLIHAVRATARYFWFPMQHVQPSEAVRLLRTLGGLIIVAHAVAAFWYLSRKGGLTVKTGTLALLLLLALTAQVRVAILWMAVEARFIFPALAAIVFFLVVPVAGVFKRWGRSERFIWIYFCALALHGYLFLPFVQNP